MVVGHEETFGSLSMTHGDYGGNYRSGRADYCYPQRSLAGFLGG
jgi:hypothetical protein